MQRPVRQSITHSPLMLKKAQITTRLLSVTDSGDETILTESCGGCLIEESGVMLRYQEERNHGTATLIIGDALAQLRRKGDVDSRLTFVEGQLIPADYVTGGNRLDFSLFTHSRTFELDARGGRLQLRYTLLLAGTQVADNTLTIQWNFV